MKILVIVINIVILLLLFLGIFAGVGYMYKSSQYTNIIAVFNEADPFPAKMNVFYKGFQIGKVVKVEPNEDYTATNMQIVLFPKNIKLPNNIKVKVRNYKDSVDYVDIISPELASTEFLKDGDKVEGTVAKCASDFLDQHVDNGNLELIIQHVVTVLDGVDKTVAETNELIANIKTTFQAVSPSIIDSSKSFSVVSDNISDISTKVNNSVNQSSLNKTMDSLESTSKSVAAITQSIDSATKDLPETMSMVNSITRDVSGITSGVNNTLQKPFGGIRFLFGSPVSACGCSKK